MKAVLVVFFLAAPVVISAVSIELSNHTESAVEEADPAVDSVALFEIGGDGKPNTDHAVQLPDDTAKLATDLSNQGQITDSSHESDHRSFSRHTCMHACPSGSPGPPGPPGQPGRDGRDGRDVTMCSVCQPKVPHTTPRPAVSSDAPTRSGSTVYVRWGRTVCNSSSESVYSGILGGAHYSKQGNGANHLCLPESPIYGTISVPSPASMIYSGEYQTSGFGNFGILYNHSPPCTVCLARGRSVKLMVPARNECPSTAWTLEYRGYLMSAHDSESKTQYICVDENAEAIPGTAANVNGATIFPVVSKCLTGGGLPCGPYVDGRALTCAVCTL